MKKVICIILMIMFLLGGVLGSKAEETKLIDFEIDDSSWLSSSVWVEDKVYMTVDGGFFSYMPGDNGLVELRVEDRRTQLNKAEKTSLSDSESSTYFGMRLFTDDEKLYAIDFVEGEMICPIVIEGDTVVIHDGARINIEPLCSINMYDEEYVEEPIQIMGYHDRLYLIRQVREGMMTDLLSYDIKNGGEASVHGIHGVWSIAPYRDEKLLALAMDEEQGWDENENRTKNYLFRVYDPRIDRVEELFDSGISFTYDGSAFRYNGDKDEIYLKTQGKVYLYQEKENKKAELVAYAPSNPGGWTLSDSMNIVSEGILFVTGHHIAFREADSAKLSSGHLTIFGADHMDTTHQKTVRDMNGLPVSFLNNKVYSSAQELGQALVSGEDDIDIFIIRSNYIDINKLMSKGYVLNLSENLFLQNYVNTLYPDMKAAGKYEGSLFMIPTYMIVGSPVSYFTRTHELFGEELKLPETYDEMIDLFEYWDDYLAEKYPDIVPMDHVNHKEWMVQLAIRMHQDDAVIKNKEFDFNDPHFVQMLTQAVNLRTDNIFSMNDQISTDAREQMNDIYGKIPLFSEWTWFDLESLNSSLDRDSLGGFGGGEEYQVGYPIPLQLAISKGEKPVTQITLTLMAVNPRSKNINAAITYIEEYIQNIDQIQRVMMNPNMNEPILNHEYEQEIQWMTDYLKNIEEEMKNVDGAEKTEFEQNYRRMKLEYDTNIEKNKYYITKEAIDIYRSLIENSYISLSGQYIGLIGDEINTLRRRLIHGQISVEQFVSEAEGKMRLKRLEGL